jgi:hypothetical protein
MILCAPALIYLAISLLGLLLSVSVAKISVSSLVTSVILLGLWTWFLNYLCSQGMTRVSWFLLVLPWLLMIGLFTLVLVAIKK